MVALCFLQDLSERRLQFLDRKLGPLLYSSFHSGNVVLREFLIALAREQK
jgi:hypothetical protein